MKRVAIISNPYKDENGAKAAALLAKLQAAGLYAYVVVDKNELAAFRPDVLVVFGGDGTILRAALIAAPASLPIVGVNLGQLGFLAEFEADDASLSSLVSHIANDDLKADKRTMLKVTVRNKSYLALNDVVLQRGLASGDKVVVNLSAYADGNLLGNYVADGIVVATPTGSTGYFLSAGGNVLAPDIRALAVAPICAHSLSSRPIILPDDKLVEVVVNEGAEAVLVCDGKERLRLKTGEKITVRRLNKPLRFLRSNEWNFYDILYKKLSAWSKE